MRDLDVRLAVRSRLQREHEGDADTRIVEEMGVWHGSVRVDLAVINGEIAGYELKSAKDTLERLPQQASLYSQVFDRVFLVAARKHVDHALPLIPSWWGILSAFECENQIELSVVRAAEPNPSICTLQVARLLWRTEALEILDRYGLAKGVKSASREKIAAKLASSLSASLLATEVRRRLKDRLSWLGQPVGN